MQIVLFIGKFVEKTVPSPIQVRFDNSDLATYLACITAYQPVAKGLKMIYLTVVTIS